MKSKFEIFPSENQKKLSIKIIVVKLKNLFDFMKQNRN
jgi:hypothetical protein